MPARSSPNRQDCAGTCGRKMVGWAYGEWLVIRGCQVWMCWQCQVKRRDKMARAAARVIPTEPVQIPLTELAEFF